MDRKYTAFISYRHAKLDSAVAKKLHSLIEQYRIPKDLRRGGEKSLGIVFRDEEELHAASDLSAEICSALDNSDYLLVICSENTPHSPWVPREIEHFLKKHDRAFILPVLVSGEPNEVFPYPLTHALDEETGSTSIVEPLAVDVRARSISGVCRNLQRQLPRLLAPIIGCEYDDLVMREQKRKIRRIAAVSAAALSILVGFSSMLLVKNREIEQKNTELEQQKAAVQLRESQLLTLDAQEALENGDYSSAIENALAALPKAGEENRPYYAPAEGALMEAMNVFGDGNVPVVLRNTDLTQITSITDFGISSDGSRLVTIDAYGETNCYDTQTGAPLWKSTAADLDSIPSYAIRYIIFPADPDIVICNHGGILEAYNLNSGSLLWRKDLLHAEHEYLFYHPETDRLVYAEYQILELSSYQYLLQSFSAQTGETQQTITLASTSHIDYAFSSFSADSRKQSGVFSSDGTRFIGTFFDENDVLCCFLADFTQSTAEIIYRHDQPGNYNSAVIGMDYREDLNTLILAVQDLSDDTSISVLNIDPAGSTLLNQTDLETDPDEWLLWNNDSYVLFQPEFVLVGFLDQLYCLDSKTCDVRSSTSLPGTLTSLTMVSDFCFGFSVESGTYAIGWQNENGELTLSTDYFFQVSAETGPHKQFQIWGGGIVQLYINDQLMTLSVSNSVSPGCVAYVPEEQTNTVRIVHPFQPSSTVERTAFDTPGKKYAITYGTTALRTGDRLIIGPLSESDTGTYSSEYCFVTIDPNTNELLSVTPLEISTGYDPIYWLPDGNGSIVHHSYEAITVSGKNGSKILYSLEDHSIIEDQSGTLYIASVLKSASEYLSENTDLLTVMCDQDTLHLWRNGIPEKQIPLPTKAVFSREFGTGATRLLKVGANGYILTNLQRSDEPAAIGSIIAWDTVAETWTEFEGDTAVSSPDVIALARENTWMAALDTAGTIRIYDLSTGKEISQFPAQLSANAVIQMDFLLKDTCIMVKTDDNRVVIYDLADGSILFRDQFGSGNNKLRAYADEANQRLYLTVGDAYNGPNALCLDLRSWTRLVYIDDMLFFDSETGILYQCSRSVTGNIFSHITVPDTASLVEIAANSIR